MSNFAAGHGQVTGTNNDRNRQQVTNLPQFAIAPAAQPGPMPSGAVVVYTSTNGAPNGPMRPLVLHPEAVQVALFANETMRDDGQCVESTQFLPADNASR